jgi:hypothetical protein
LIETYQIGESLAGDLAYQKARRRIHKVTPTVSWTNIEGGMTFAVGLNLHRNSVGSGLQGQPH